MNTQDINRAEAGGIRNGSQNPSDSSTELKRFLDTNYDEIEGDLQANLNESIRTPRKIIRLYRCFPCNKDKPPKRFSRCLVIYKDCYSDCDEKGAIALRNFRDRTLNNVHKYLRRGLI